MTSAQESNGKESVGLRHRTAAKVSSAWIPNILDAWVMLGNEYFRKRDFRPALEQYKRALCDQARLRSGHDQSGRRLSRAGRL